MKTLNPFAPTEQTRSVTTKKRGFPWLSYLLSLGGVGACVGLSACFLLSGGNASLHFYVTYLLVGVVGGVLSSVVVVPYAMLKQNSRGENVAEADREGSKKKSKGSASLMTKKSGRNLTDYTEVTEK